MTMESVSYILIAPEGFHLSLEMRWLGYAIAGAVTLVLLAMFLHYIRKQIRP